MKVRKMGSEEQSQKCGNSSSGGGRSTKKGKQKKVPQRGLGVAQLEKIRLEEQQFKDASSSSLSVVHQPNQPSPSSIPFPHSPNSLFRTPHNIDVIDTGWPPKEVLPALPFYSNLTLPYESQPCSMVNVSSSSSSSLPNFQIEPPSNQSFHSNYRPMWPDEDKMVGVKRPYPLSMETPPGHSFHCKLPTIAHPMFDESASYGNGNTFMLEPSHPIFREVPSCSTPMSQLNSKKTKDKPGFGGDFLTLGPPTTTTMTHAPKFKQSSCYLTFPNPELPDFDSLPYQGSAEETMFESGPSGWNQQPAFYSFFPPEKTQTSQATTSINCYNVQVEETIDLNLKL